MVSRAFSSGASITGMALGLQLNPARLISEADIAGSVNLVLMALPMGKAQAQNTKWKKKVIAPLIWSENT